MDKKSAVTYWLESSEDDWKSANIFLKKETMLIHCFLGHLTIEKILKALFVEKTGNAPPYTHRLVSLSEKVALKLTDEQLELLVVITDFNMEARNPDEKFSFKKKCTRNFTETYLFKIKEMKEWLLRMIQQ
ncbi:MAG: HEPN domain-containing protein [Candidatus Brocadiaceae bacterium]|nr:HEPN domain-containing protein [Candidatus Brocadiaceae bacterium]